MKISINHKNKNYTWTHGKDISTSTRCYFSPVYEFKVPKPTSFISKARELIQKLLWKSEHARLLWKILKRGDLGVWAVLPPDKYYNVL